MGGKKSSPIHQTWKVLINWCRDYLLLMQANAGRDSGRTFQMQANNEQTLNEKKKKGCKKVKGSLNVFSCCIHDKGNMTI